MLHSLHTVSLLSLASAALGALPIPNIIPFTVDGALAGCTVDNATEYNSGGTISVNGFNIKVPKNLIAQFPVTWVPFAQVCGAGISGYELSVFGNVVGSQAIAAQIIVGSPFLVEASQGYIESINITDGSLQIKGGPKVRINDPNAVFSKGTTELPLFQADDESPSITAFSGFPMCIPRSATDVKCPSSNRPSGQTTFAAPDPLTMAPLLAGDFIEYSGIHKGNGEVLAWEITAINVQITTVASNTVPNYIRMEDAIIGVFDNNANVELADIRFIGYLSSCSGASVSINAIDVDPCTGNETIRQVGTAVPRQELRCKWEFRADTTAQSTYTREYLIKANSPVVETKNGIQASQYVQPVTEWIQPEVDIPGAEPPPNRFSDIRGLVQGDFLDGKQYGPLSPFPGPPPPAPSKTCGSSGVPTASASTVPVASAAPVPAAQRVGAQVLLVGSNTAPGIDSGDLAYNWTKASPASATVSIQNPASATATFVAPKVIVDTNVTFSVTVSLKSDPSKFSKANVTVKVSPTASDVVSVDVYTWESRQSGTIHVECHSNVVNGDNKKMSLLLNGATTLPMIAGTGAGKWVYDNRSVNKPTSVQCVSDLNGKSAVVTATTRRRKRGGA